MRTLPTILLLWTLLFHGLTAQEVISVNYIGQQGIPKSARDAIEASGYTPVFSLNAYTLNIVGTASTFMLDSIKFEALEEQEFKQYLCWKKTSKSYNDKTFSYTDCSFQGEVCYSGDIEYITEVAIDRNRTRKILGFTCYPATYQIDGTEYMVWFTEELPFPDGPFGLDIVNKIKIPLLPGLVLQFEENTTGTYYKAVDIKVSSVANDVVEADQACPTTETIDKYDKVDYIGRTQEQAVRLVGKEIVVDQWYNARQTNGSD